jgi:acetyltransferase
MTSVSQLKLFLEPKSIAVVGANPNTGEQAFNVVENLANCGYQGKVYPVNPNYMEILGKKCYPSVNHIPDDIDLAIIVTPRQTISQIVKQCGEKGIRAAIVVGQGFADADDEGKRLQQELVNVAHKSGVRILGPNTVGSANAFIDFSAAFLKQTDIRKQPVAIVCQSGLFFGTVGRLKLLGKGLDLGNACDIDVAEAMEYFAEDPQIKVIVLHIEGIRGDGKKFREAAQRVTKKKPVLALKTGRTERSARAAQSHTGSLVGKDEVWDAVFKQSGIIRANDIDELGDLVKTFSYLPFMKGKGIGVVTASGGIGIMTLDACAKYNLEVVELTPKTKRRLNSMSPTWYKAGNPLDIWPLIINSTRPFGETLRTAMTEVLSDPRVNAIVVFAGAWFQGFKPLITDVMKETADAFPDKPIAWCPYDGWLFNIRSRDLQDKMEETGRAAVFSIPDDAVRALSKLADYSEFRKRFSQ